MSAAEVLALRCALSDNGYTPLPLYGKVPPAYGKNNKVRGLDRWQELSNVNYSQCEMWSRLWPNAENTGILTANTPTLDADILDEAACDAIEAFVKDRFEERGYVLVRCGLWPKFCIPFRTIDPFDKIVVNLIAPNKKPGQKLEFLCKGQQVVVDGIHPDTGKPYNWHSGEPWKIKHDELPYINDEEARQLIDDVVELLIRDFGYSRTADRPKRAKTKTNGREDPLANEQDWQHLIDNILKGHELHDSLRDLAAKYAASGMGNGAIVNSLRALMEASSAVKDDRWQDRFDDIPRLVRSAVDKYAPQEEEEEQQPTGTVPPIQPPPPGAQPGSQPNSAQIAAVEEILRVFREWLLLDSDVPVLAILGTLAANALPGDPVWLGLIAPPSSAKTEMLVALRKMPHVEMTDGTMTPAGLLSGTPRKQQRAGATGGLLNKIGKFGYLVAKDFGAILSMRPDNRNEMLQVFRDIYDGRWSRTLGSDGGRKLVWEGKIGLLFGCTREFDSHYSVISELGDRFLLCRMEPNRNQFRFAMKQIGKGPMMRARMADAVAKLFAIPLQPPRLLDQAEIDELDEMIQLAVALRAPVKRDNRTRDLEGSLGVEGTGRFGKALERLLAGLDSLGIERAAAFTVIKTIAFDSVPPNRLKVYRKLQELFPNWADRKSISEAIGLPSTTTRRVLEELVVYQLAEIDMNRNPYLWRAC